MRNKIIAVDFDGTLCEDKYPEIGEPNEKLISDLIKRREAGDKLVLWTCREGKDLMDAVYWCYKHGLIFDAINKNVNDTVERFGFDSRKVLADIYIDDKNQEVDPFCGGKKSWAEREVEIACKREVFDKEEEGFDYGCACYESALKAYKSLLRDGHSGFSIRMTKNILNRLIDHKPLTPIEDTDDVWGEGKRRNISGSEYVSYQCLRMSSLFKKVYPDGSIIYEDVNRYHSVCIDNPNVHYHSGFIDKVMDELFPIEMPYYPADKPFIVMCENFLVDERNGDFDTIGVYTATTPDGKMIIVNRYFKEEGNGFVEISETKFNERKRRRIQRKEEEQMEDLCKEVYFDHYCETCKHEKLAEDQEPCNECLNEPVNTYSHKPVKWEEKS